MRATTVAAVMALLKKKSSSEAAKILLEQTKQRTVGCGLKDAYSLFLQHLALRTAVWRGR